MKDLQNTIQELTRELLRAHNPALKHYYSAQLKVAKNALKEMQKDG